MNYMQLKNTVTLCIIGSLLLIFSDNVNNELSRIVLSPSQVHCPEAQTSCLTLDKFAANSEHYLQNNAELILLSGNHSLHSKLEIAHINHLWIYPNLSTYSLGTTIACANQGARFEFTSIFHVLVSGVHFLGCGRNRVDSVKSFILVNSSFEGQKGNSGTALELVNSTIEIKRSFFSNSNGSYRLWFVNSNDTKLYARIGGAVIVNQSNASFSDCHFKRNCAELGGAIFGDFTSKISINNSKFDNNSAKFRGRHCYRGYGGAVFGGSISTVSFNSSNVINKTSGTLSIFASNFTNNEADFGGAVAIFHINVSVHGSKFTNNKVTEIGGAIFSNKSSIANVSKTEFTNNIVTNGYGGAVYVFNSTLEVLNSNFNHNLATIAHGGAMCLHEATISIYDCNFCFNVAGTFGGAVYTRNSQYLLIVRCSFDTNTVTLPEGGGRQIRIYREANLTVTNSTFFNHNVENKALHNLTSNCQESRAGYGVSSVGVVMTSSTVSFHNTKFSGTCESIYSFKCNINFTGNNSFVKVDNEESKAYTALYIIESIVSMHGRSNLMHNTAMNGGAIHAAESRIDVNGVLTVANNTAIDSGGGIYLSRSELNCKIRSTLSLIGNTAANKGGGLHAIGSTIKATYVRDYYTRRALLYFIENIAFNGGGAYLEANAKIYVFKEGSTRDHLNHNSSIFFDSNVAVDSGGVVYIADETNAAICDSTGSHHSDATECFVQVLTVLLTEEVQKNTDLIGLEFQNNSAPSGAVLFGGLLDRCTLSPIAEIYKYYGRVYFHAITYLLNITNLQIRDLNSQVIRSKSVQVCFCRDNIPDCNYQPPAIKVNKGEKFNVSLVAVDQINHTVTNVTIYSSMETVSNWLYRDQSVQYTGEGCTNLTFSVLSLRSFVSDKLLISTDGPCKSANRSKRALQIHLQRCTCPVGFERSSKLEKCKCACDSRLKDYTTTCDVATKMLVREKNFWISDVTVNGDATYCNSTVYLGHLNCPFDYCIPGSFKIEVNLDMPNGADVQCANNRIGILCGQCKHGYSLSIGSSHCIYCSQYWVAGMIGFITAVFIVGFILVTVLLLLNLTVASGTISGLILYANIVSSTSEPIHFASPRIVIAWLNLEHGFEICLINGLDAYWKTWLTFIFPAYYVFILVALVMVACRFSPKFSRLIGKRNPVATLNTLIFLSYTKLLHTVISIFLVTTLDCPGGSSKSVKLWAVDPTIKYLSPKHFALFLVAILIVIMGLVYTFLIFSWQWLLYYQDKWIFRWIRNQKLCQFLEPYHAPYTFKHRYWAGLLLFLRVVLFVVLATNTSHDPYLSLVAISIAVGSILFLKGMFCRVYRNHLPNFLETVCLMNVIFLCIANFYTINMIKLYYCCKPPKIM